MGTSTDLGRGDRRQTDPNTLATTVTLELDFQGDELAERTVRSAGRSGPTIPRTSARRCTTRSSSWALARVLMPV